MYGNVMSHESEEWSKEKLFLEKHPFLVGYNRLEAVSGS